MNIELRYAIAHPAEAVWNALSTFDDVSWNNRALESMTVEGEGIGMTRTLYWTTAPYSLPTIERLELLDHAQRIITYSIVQCAADIFEDSWIRIQVLPRGDNSCTLLVDYKLVDSELTRGDEFKTFLHLWTAEVTESLDNYLHQQAAVSRTPPEQPALRHATL